MRAIIRPVSVVWQYTDPLSSAQSFSKSDPFQSNNPTSDTSFHDGVAIDGVLDWSSGLLNTYRE
jgi:hypothetical protein